MVVKQEFIAKIDKLEAAYHRLERHNTKLIEQNRKLAQSSRRGSEQAETGFRRAGQAAMTAVASYLSVASAIGAITAAMRDRAEVERSARDATLSVADAQIKALRNLGPVSTEIRSRFTADMKALADETKVGLAPLYLAASAGLSASGGNVEATMKALRAAARIAPESPEEMTAVAGALLHLGKATKSEDAMANLGFMLGVGQQAAVTETGKIASNISKGVIGVAGYGGTAKESGAIVAAITQGMADAEGRFSSTAAISLAKNLDELVGKGSPLANIRYLQQHPEARAEFLARTTFETKAQVPIEQLLGEATRGDVTAKFFEKALVSIPEVSEAAPIAEAMIEDIREPYEQGLAEQARAGKSTLEQLKMTPEGRLRALRGQYALGGEEGLLTTLQQAGVPWLERQGIGMGWGLKPGGNIDYTGQQLAILVDQMKRGREAGEDISAEKIRVLEDRLTVVVAAREQEQELLRQIRDAAAGGGKVAEQLTIGVE